MERVGRTQRRASASEPFVSGSVESQQAAVQGCDCPAPALVNLPLDARDVSPDDARRRVGRDDNSVFRRKDTYQRRRKCQKRQCAASAILPIRSWARREQSFRP